MSALLVVGVGVGVGLGAQLRYAAERLHARSRVRRGLARATFPWATLAVNGLGSALLGAVAALVLRGTLDPGWQTVLGTGVAGGLTTFSTLSFDIVELARERRYARAILNAAANVVLGLAAAAAGYHLI
jgi:CrcB protein